MKQGIYCLDDVNLPGKTILCRVDLNSPLTPAGTPGDIYRIERAIPSIKELSAAGAKVVLMSHQGGDLEYQNYGSTEHHAKIIAEKSGIPVKFIDDVCGPAARSSIKDLRQGEILLLDNVRFMAEELTLFENKLNLDYAQQANTLLVRKLAPLADLFMCDAFAAAHRSQPTLVGFPFRLPSFMGRLFEEELSVLAGILHAPAKPSLFILGGSKVEDAFMIMSKVLQDEIADEVLTCGLIGNVMLLAEGIDIGKPSKDLLIQKKLMEYVDISKKMLEKYKERIVLPVDLSFQKNGRKEISVNNLPVDELLVDLGKNTVEIYTGKIKSSATIFINGPAGMFENEESLYGTKVLWEAAAFSDAFTTIGGGDSIAAANKFGILDRFSYTCTGGGALVRYLSGEELPVIKALRQSALKFPIKNENRG